MSDNSDEAVIRTIKLINNVYYLGIEVTAIDKDEIERTDKIKIRKSMLYGCSNVIIKLSYSSDEKNYQFNDLINTRDSHEISKLLQEVLQWKYIKNYSSTKFEKIIDNNKTKEYKITYMLNDHYRYENGNEITKTSSLEFYVFIKRDVFSNDWCQEIKTRLFR